MSRSKQCTIEKVLAITLTALQIPLLLLWKITYDAVELESHRIEANSQGGYELVFKWELLGKAIRLYLPVFLLLLACLVLSVWGMLSILRKKQMGISTVCFYAATVVACGGLWYAFSRPYIIVGLDHVNFLELCEYSFYRSFTDHAADKLTLLRSIKFVLLGLHIAVSSALCGLGIVDLVQKKRASSTTEPEALYEIKPL